MSHHPSREITLAAACAALGCSETTLRKFLPRLQHRFDPARGCRVILAADVAKLGADLEEERRNRGNWRARNLGPYARKNRPSVPPKGQGRDPRSRAPNSDGAPAAPASSMRRWS